MNSLTAKFRDNLEVEADAAKAIRQAQQEFTNSATLEAQKHPKKPKKSSPRDKAAEDQEIGQPGTAENPFKSWIAAYYHDPVAFAHDMLGIKLLDYQKGPLISMSDGQRRIAVTSGHGTGKSTVAAIAAIWFLLTRYPCRIVMTAPTLAQIDGVLMGAVRSMITQLPDALQDLLEVQRDRIFLKARPDDAWMAARTSRAEAPEALAGIHAEHVLLIADEASGIPEAVYEHAVGSMSGEHAHTLLLSNPTRRTGYFYKVFNDYLAGKDWHKFRFSCRDSELVSEDFIAQVEATYGEGSNQVRVRVDGLFPTEDIDVFIPAHIVESAMSRDIERDEGAPAVLGVDVARMGSDRTSICLRKGRRVEEVRSWEKKDLMQTVGIVVNYYQTLPHELRPNEICIDVIGLGAGVVDRLMEVSGERKWPCNILGINVAENAALDDRAHRLKDELWLQAKEWLEAGDVSLPDENDFLEDLTSPGYSFRSNGKLLIESKDEMRRRGKKSTDIADAFTLTFAGLNGRLNAGPRSSWSKPLRRNLKGIA